MAREVPVSSFYDALSLTERWEIARRVAGAARSRRDAAGDASAIVDAWRSSSPIANGDDLDRRLRAAGIPPEQLARALTLSCDAMAASAAEPPGWLQRLVDAYTTFAGSRPMVQAALDANPQGAFLYAVEPIVQAAEWRLRAALDATLARHPDAPFTTASALHFVYPSLTSHLLQMITRTFVLELNVARLSDALHGTSARERFSRFCERLREPYHALAILEEYPVLARLAVQYADTWVDASAELFERLARDLPRLRRELFGGRHVGALVALASAAGDRHRGGRSVAIATFESGDRVVYKPRSLAVDRHFQQLLAWLERRGGPALQRLHVVECRGYGWVEYARPAPCGTEAAVERFYERVGAQLALLYLLGATDVHHENLVAAGEHPVLVDLESLFTPRASNAAPPGQLAMEESVLSTGLLPVRIRFGRGDDGLDISGLSSTRGEVSPHALDRVVGAGGDEARVEARREPIRDAANLPRLSGAEVDLLDHVESIVAGFERCYDVLAAHADELLSADGPVEAFADDDVRFLFRMTAAYSHMMAQSYHPDALRSGLDQDRHWDHLWAADAAAPSALVVHEREACLRADVPLFTTRPRERALWWSPDRGIADFFAASGLESARARIRRLGAADRREQAWFIRAALAASKRARRRTPRLEPVNAARPATADELRAIASDVADRLAERALRSGDAAAWVGLCLDGDGYALLPLGPDLYSGLAGQALFLAYAGAVLDRADCTELACAAATSALAAATPALRDRFKLGAFTGAGGLIYSLAHVGAVSGDASLLDEAERALAAIADRIESDLELDVVGGVAGAIGGALAVHRCRPESRALELAVRCGQRLLATARPIGEGLGWIVPRQGALAGFAHGAAGIAWALSELGATAGDQRFTAAALRAAAYERSLVGADGLWADLRTPEPGVAKQDGTMTAWCTGAGGIGLSRLRLLQLTGDDEVRDDLEVALATTRRLGFGRDHSLCHGDLGNLELLLQWSRLRPDRERSAEVAVRAGAVVSSARRQGLVCGVPLGVETPGLMNGIAGIGYGCLRLAAPQSVPALLLLEPPLV